MQHPPAKASVAFAGGFYLEKNKGKIHQQQAPVQLHYTIHDIRGGALSSETKEQRHNSISAAEG